MTLFNHKAINLSEYIIHESKHNNEKQYGADLLNKGQCENIMGHRSFIVEGMT